MGEIRHAARKPLVAWSLTGSALVVLAAALVLLGLNASRFNASRLNAGQIGFYSLLSVGALAYAGAGGLIARRVPGNAIGWLLGLAGPAAAALFGPLRSRVQQRVDRRFNRARYSAERMLAAFAARLTEELDADAVTEDLARSVHAALEPAHVSIWLSE
jgi:hypothetical protein